MDGRKALEVQVDPRTAPVVPPAPDAPAAPIGAHVAPACPAWAEAADRLPVWAAAAAGLLGPAIAAVCMALEPAPANPDASEPVVGLVLGYALLAAWLGAAATGLARRPAALGWATGVAGLSVLMTISCPTTGHHTAVAGWWVAEMVLCLGALFVSMAGLRWWAARSGAGAAAPRSA